MSFFFRLLGMELFSLDDLVELGRKSIKNVAYSALKYLPNNIVQFGVNKIHFLLIFFLINLEFILNRL